MSKFQQEFDAMFNKTIYGPRDGFVPRDWQMECMEGYQDLVHKHLNIDPVNGSIHPQHRFTIYGGTGCGKTKALGLVAAWLLNTKYIEQVVFICPNRTIKRKVKRDLMQFFNIDLAGFSAKKHGDGIPSKFQGYILTYGHMMTNPALHHEICSYRKTLVVFDEVHHLGDNPEQRWGDSALNAFGTVPFVICLTGTPYRSDNTQIPFVSYEEIERGGLLRFKADLESGTGFSYLLGRAVADGVCRMPQFIKHTGTVQIRPIEDGPKIIASFDDKVTDAIASLRLRGAVQYGSIPRKEMLRQALKTCRDEGRKVAIFLGGDTQADLTPKMDAKDWLPSEFIELGYNPDDWLILTSDDDDAQEKMDGFEDSKKWILVSINMFSEGSDFPALSAIILLTNITAKQTTIQRIGRGLRMRGESDAIKTCLVFYFPDPALVEITDEILAEIEVEQRIKKQKRDKESPGGGERTSRAEAIGISGGEIQTVKFGEMEWPIEKFRKTQQLLREKGFPGTLLETALKLVIEESHEFAANV